MKLSRFIVLSAAAAILCSCGVSKQTSKQLQLPGAHETDSIATVLAPAGTGINVPFQGTTPKIYAFRPAADSSSMTVVTIAPEKGEWKVTGSVTYPGPDDIVMPLKSVSDSVQTRRIGSDTYIFFDLLREDGKKARKCTAIFSTAQESLQQLAFTGKTLADGRIEGSSNKDFLMADAGVQYAAARQAADKGLVVISQADLLTDEAIDWWLEKNPNALGKASVITFGSIPKESSLVASYLATKEKASSGKFRAAVFDIRGWCVIVSYNRSSDSYSLCWAEPSCKNTSKDRFLNNIYIESGNTLAMFYYQGKRTFKYRLNLGSGSLRK